MIVDSFTLIGRSIRLGRRNVDTLIMSILLPLLMMTLFVFVFGGAIDTGTRYVNYVVPGIVLLCTGYGASSTAMSVADDMSNFFMLFLPYLSSAFVPPDTMPAVLRAISEHQPVTPIIETVRGLLTGTPIGSNATLAVAWSGGLLVVSFVLATRLYRRRTGD